MSPFQYDTESHNANNHGKNHGEYTSTGAYQEDSKSLVPFPAFFESLSRQLETLCACHGTASATEAVIDEDYTEYFGHMDLTQNNNTFAIVHEDMCSEQNSMSHYPRVSRGGRRGGVDESKEPEWFDTKRREDESMRIRKDFYEPSQSRWFASTAFMVDDDAPKSAMLRKKAISAWLRPRPSSFDVYSMSSGRSAFDQYDRPQGYCVDGIAIEEDTEELSVKKGKSQHAAIGAFYFADVECYTRHRDSDVIPPISTADTYTTVSLCHSIDSCMDSTDPLDQEDDDDEDVIIVDRESISHETVSGCFRLTTPKSPPSTETLREPPETPPKLNVHRSLQRMTPQHYIHGDNPEDDQFYWSLAYSSSKYSFVDTDPSNPPPMMPELH